MGKIAFVLNLHFIPSYSHHIRARIISASKYHISVYLKYFLIP